MGKGAPSPPPPPDPAATAAAQGAVNKETAAAQARINRVDEFGPLGSRVFEEIPIEGEPDLFRAKATTTLSPLGQQAFDSQQQLSASLGDLANNQVGRVEDAIGTPFTFDGLPQAPGIDDFSADRQRIEDSIFDRQSSRLNDRFNLEQKALETQLANQGIMQGSEAFNNAFDLFGKTKNDAFAGARNDSIALSGGEQSRLFGLGSAARQQGIQERAFERNLPLNDVAALMSGTSVGLPQFGGIPQVGVGGADILGANALALQQGNAAAAQRAAANNSLNGGLFGLGAAGLGGFAASDIGSAAIASMF